MGKGPDVTLSGSSQFNESQRPETPSLINCRNISFKFIPGDEAEDEDESEGEGTDKVYIPSPKPDIPKGHVNDKKSKFEKQTPAKNAGDAKELAKQNRNYRKNSKLPGPTNKKNKKEEEQNPNKDEDMETENLQQKKDPKEDENLQQKKDQKENENLQQKNDQD